MEENILFSQIDKTERTRALYLEQYLELKKKCKKWHKKGIYWKKTAVFDKYHFLLLDNLLSLLKTGC